MSDDRALEGRALRELVEVRSDAMKDEPQHVRIAVLAVSGEDEASLESDDVRFGVEIFGELRIEQPRRADPHTRRRLWEMAREKWLRAPERVIARVRSERSALGDVDAESRIAVAKRVADVSRASPH